MQSFENIQADKNNYAENSFHDDHKHNGPSSIKMIRFFCPVLWSFKIVFVQEDTF
jgi:hypothetical protein